MFLDTGLPWEQNRFQLSGGQHRLLEALRRAGRRRHGADRGQQNGKAIPGVTIGHSATFTWDGEILVFGHEPGGGGLARCQASSTEVDRTLFFFNARTGAPAGTFPHPRPQTANENCTWHNMNVVPTDKRYILVSGNYQSGISVLDFSNPSAAKEIAFADPAPLSDTGLIAGGDWSTYWYDGRIYESDVKRGLIVWNLSDSAVAGAKAGRITDRAHGAAAMTANIVRLIEN